MNPRQFGLAGLLFTMSFSHSRAQQTSAQDSLRISLADVWSKAEAYSRTLNIKRKEVEIRHEEVKDAIIERLPEFGVSGSAEKASNLPVYVNGLFSTPSQHEIIHTLYRVGTDLRMNLYNGNKQNLKIQENKIVLLISQIQNNEAVSTIRYKSASLYLELQKLLIYDDVIKKDILNQEQQLKEIKAFHKNGVVLKSDILRVEFDLSKRKLLQVQIENDIRIVTQKLNIIIGEPDERPIVPADNLSLTKNELPTYQECLAQALEHSFPYKISEQKTTLSELNLRQVKANVRPTVGLYGDFYYANPQIFLYPYNPYWYSLGIAGVKASFPISSLYHNKHKEQSARLEWEKEEIVHHDTEDKVRQQVKEAYLRYTEALIEIDVTQTNLNQALENARIVKDNYFNQTALITDLLDADIQVLQTQFALADATVMAQTKFYSLQNIIGIL